MITAHREVRGISTAGVKNAYRVGEGVYGGRAKYTVYELARDLLADGHDWDQDLQIINPDGVVALRGALSEMCGVQLSEGQAGFSLAKYRPFDATEVWAGSPQAERPGRCTGCSVRRSGAAICDGGLIAQLAP